jgi:thioesterase domain-containing protein
MRPATIEVLEALPLGTTGKVDRAALAARESPAPTAPRLDRGLASPTETDLAKLWGEILGGQAVGPEDRFLDLGGSSLDAVRLVNRINQRWGLRLAVREIYDQPALAALAERVDQARAAARTTEPRIVTLRAGGGDGPPLYFYHDGPIEVRLAELVGARPAFAIEQVWPGAWVGGSAGARPRLPSAAEIVAPVVDRLLEHAGGQPFLLAGYSTRGVLACELARQAAERGGRPQLLLLFDSWARLPTRLDVAKGRWRRGRATADPAATAHLWRLGYETLRAGLHHSRRVVWPALGLRVPNASAARYTTHVTEDGRVLTWGEAEPVYLNILRTFVPPRLPCRGVLFVAERHMAAGRELDPSQGWAGVFGQGLDLVPVATDHAFADEDALAAQVRAGLAQALAAAAPPAAAGQASLEADAARA